MWQAFVDDAAMTGQALDDFLEANFGRGLSMTFMANQVPRKSNRIELHPTVKDKWGRQAAYIIKGWHPHDIALMNVYSGVCHDVLEKGGVRSVLEPAESMAMTISLDGQSYFGWRPLRHRS